MPIRLPDVERHRLIVENRFGFGALSSTRLVVGPNGAGSLNLSESLHVGTQGFCRDTRRCTLVEFGERAGRIALQGRRGDNALQLEVTWRSAKESARRSTAPRCVPPNSCAAKSPRSSSRLTGPGGQGRSCGAPRVLRPGAGPSRPGTRFARSRVRRGRGATQRGTADARPVVIRPRRDRPVDRAGRDARPPTRRSSHGGRGVARRPLRNGAEELGLPAARMTYEGEPPTVESLEARLDRDLERERRAAATPRRHRLDGADPRSAELRLARASSASPCSRFCSPRPR